MEAISVTHVPREHFMTKDQLIAENKQLREENECMQTRIANDALRLKKLKAKK